MLPGLRLHDFFGLAFLLVFGAVHLCVNIVICFFLYKFYNRVPAQFRQMDPGLVWLLLIPCFNLVWNFFVFLRLSRSLKAYYTSTANVAVGDCAEGLGLAYSICEVATVIPCFGLVAWAAAIVLLILYLIKADELTRQIPAVA